MQLKNLALALCMLGTHLHLMGMQSSEERLKKYQDALETGDCKAVVYATKELRNLHITLDQVTGELCIGGSIAGLTPQEQQPYKDALLDFVIDTLAPVIDLSRSTLNLKKDAEEVLEKIDTLVGKKTNFFGAQFFSGILHDNITVPFPKELENRVADTLKAAVCKVCGLDPNKHNVSSVQDDAIDPILEQVRVPRVPRDYGTVSLIDLDSGTGTATTTIVLTDGVTDHNLKLGCRSSRALYSRLWVAAPIIAIACYGIYKKYRSKRAAKQAELHAVSPQQDETGILNSADEKVCIREC